MITLLASLLLTLPAQAQKQAVDIHHSSVNFVAKHLMISLIPGRFNEFNGSLDLDTNDFTKSKVEFTVQVASISTAVTARDEHLRSPDFFDAASFPEATFRSTAIEKVDDHYSMTGDLTIRGITKPVSFRVKMVGTVEDPMLKTQKTVFRATGTINRKDFGVSYGDNAIVSDEITLALNLETMPAASEKPKL